MKVITTVGTSIFSNADEDTEVFKREYNEAYFNGSSDERISETIKEKINSLTAFAKHNKSSSCAEINSILKIKDEVDDDKKIANKKLEIYLICTQTISSRIAAECIKAFFNTSNSQDGIEVENVEVIDKLNVDNQDSYDDGFSNLIEHLSKDIKHQKGDVLNITGGYKALVPILTLYGQLQDLTLKYIYDDKELNKAKLITLGALPISFDWEVVEQYSTYLFNDNKLRKGGSVVEEMLSIGLVKKITNEFERTALGLLLQEHIKGRPSPFTGTIMGYLVEHKLFKYYLLSNRYDTVEHSVTFKKKVDGEKVQGDMDLVLEGSTGLVAVEIKPASVLENLFNSWEKLKEQLPKRLEALALEKNKKIKEVWLFLYGEDADDIKQEVIPNLAALIGGKALKCKFLKIKKAKLSQEQHVYQRFFKSSIKENQIEDIDYTNV